VSISEQYEEIVNLTGHDLTVIDSTGTPHTVKPVGQARVNSGMRPIGVALVSEAAIPILEISERSVVDLPTSRNGSLYVVSGLVAAKANRPDVVSPSRLVRERGVVVGCSAFARVVP
jgi:hypothetical protein